MSLTPEQQRDLVLGWKSWSDQLKEVQGQEKAARFALAQAFFPTPREGTQRHEFANGYKLKLTHTLTFKLGDKDKVNESGEKIPAHKQVEAVIEKIEALGNEGSFIADTLFTVEYKLNVQAYKALDPESYIGRQIRDLVDEILKITPPGTPQIELEEP